MLIDWTDHRPAASARCPACRHEGAMARAFSYRAESLRELAGGDEIGLLRCPRCDVLFCDPLVSVDYQDADERGAKFYLESGAGIDVMLEALSLADDRPVRRYLEIGCAFGFILDYARRMLGWEVRGFDPGGLARLGRELLDLPIENRFFQTGQGFDRWADLVFCSEVIEHIPEPGPFLDLLVSALGPEGQLVLTTPNGDALRESEDPAVLSAILSPGHHIVLYNPASIEALLKRHGFAEIRIEENGFQLRVAAARTKFRGRSGWVGRERYRDYLRALSNEHAADQPLGAGLAYRLFKEEVNAGRYAEAEEPWRRIEQAYRGRYGIELAEPDGLPLPEAGLSFEECGERWPFNLCGMLYFRGIALWLGAGRPAEAAPFFRAAGRIGGVVRGILRTAGVDDLELADLTRQAFPALLSALAQCDPAAAVEALRDGGGEAASRRLFVDLINLGHFDQAEAVRAPMDETTAYAHARLLLNRGRTGEAMSLFLGLPERQRDLMRRDLFTDLVNLGHMDAAGAVLEGGDLPAGDPPASYASAMFLLVGKGDFAGAAARFGKIADDSRGAYFWPARFHQGLAARMGGDPAAGQIADAIERPAEGLPPVPEALKARLGELRGE